MIYFSDPACYTVVHVPQLVFKTPDNPDRTRNELRHYPGEIFVLEFRHTNLVAVSAQVSASLLILNVPYHKFIVEQSGRDISDVPTAIRVVLICAVYFSTQMTSIGPLQFYTLHVNKTVN